MSTARFLTELFESGRVSIGQDFTTELDVEADAVLVSAEKVAAANLAGESPGFSLPIARWAAVLLYRSCQFLVCRDIDSKAIEEVLRLKCPDSHSPETDYSVDLIFQYLPDLVGMTKAVARGDPLLQQLLVLGREWPLSSVGIPDIGAVEVKGFVDHAGLRQLYADRIMAAADTARLGSPVVDRCIRDALGDFPDLCKSIAARLAQSNPDLNPGDVAASGN